MHLTSKTKVRLPRLTLRVGALLCAVLVWLLGMMAASPLLHATLHDDADHADHECAVTLFSHGAEDPVPMAQTAVSPTQLVEVTVRAPEAPQTGSPSFRLMPSRGPPHC